MLAKQLLARFFTNLSSAIEGQQIPHNHQHFQYLQIGKVSPKMIVGITRT